MERRSRPGSGSGTPGSVIRRGALEEVHEARRSRLRDGGAAMVSTGAARIRPLASLGAASEGRAAASSSVNSRSPPGTSGSRAVVTPAVLRQRRSAAAATRESGGAASSMSAASTSSETFWRERLPAAQEALPPEFMGRFERQTSEDSQFDRLTGGSATPERLTFRNDDEDEDARGLDEGDDPEGASELALRARLHGLQRQLEGLQLATATLQAVVGHTGSAAQATRGVHSDQEDRLTFVDPAPEDGEERSVFRRAAQLRPRISARQMAAQRRLEREAADPSNATDDEVHPSVTCDGCGAGPPLFGQVFKCTECEDFDFCARCYRDRSRLGHPQSHRFVPRSAVQEQRSNFLLQGGQGPMASILLRLLEAEVLYEALQQSGEPERVEETQEEKEMRSAQVLSTLDRVRYAPSSERGKDGHQAPDCEECCLCLDEYSLGEEVLKLPCGHLFHEGCLGPWFTKSLTCPLCKFEVSAVPES